MNEDVKKIGKADEREIDLIHLIYNLLRGWRSIIICTLVFAVILGGLKYTRDVQGSGAGITYQTAVEGLSEQELEEVEKALSYQRRMEDKLSYNNNSIRMNLNAYEKSTVTLQYYVDTDYVVDISQPIQKDYASELVDCYVSFVENKGIINELDFDWKADEALLSELISVGGRVNNSTDQTNAVKEFSGTFNIYIIGEDLDMANELADAVETCVNEYQAMLSQKIGEHVLNLVGRSESLVADKTLADEQISVANSLVEMKTKLKDMTGALSSLQLQVFNGEPQQDKAEQSSIRVTPNIKYILLGGIIGLIIACGMIAFHYILSGNIKTIKEVQNIYQLRLLGSVRIDLGKKKVLSFVDNWIDLFFGNEKVPLEEQEQLVVANLLMTCKKNNIKEIFITTSLHFDEQEQAVIDNLVKVMEMAGVNIIYAENVIRNAKSFEQMANVENAIIIERLEKTKYTLFENELTLLEHQQINIMGTIIIESY